MKIDDLLNNPKDSLLIIRDGDVKDIVIGVPHHSPLGVEKLRCKNDRNSDENAGLLGYLIAQGLNCNSIIACNYFIDPNKTTGSDYLEKIELWKPKILTEIHGHGGKSAKFDIEISSGSMERNLWSKELEFRLKNKLSELPELKNYAISGDFNAIHFQAKETSSINTTKWVSFHIELPKSIRESDSLFEPFCNSLVEVLKEILADYNELDSLSNSLKSINEQKIEVPWSKADRIYCLIKEVIPNELEADVAYQNAQANSDKQNARIEHDKALARVITALLKDDTELFKQFFDNESFRTWLADKMFSLTYKPVGDENERKSF